MSLRLRLLIGMLALAALALVVADAVTYTSLDSFLTTRLDQQLAETRDPLFHSFGPSPGPGSLSEAGHGAGPPGGPLPIPPETYAALIDGHGVVLQQVTFGFTASEQAARPVLPSPLPLPTGERPTFLTTPGTGGIGTYRVAIQAPDPNDPAATQGHFLVTAIPRNGVVATLQRLLVVELGIGFATLAGLAALGTWAVRLGLRPLDRMGETAGAIAAGDLSRRVEPATPRTEVGRLGLALNAMLAQIERAFAARAASEERLRRFIADASHELPHRSAPFVATPSSSGVAPLPTPRTSSWRCAASRRRRRAWAGWWTTCCSLLAWTRDAPWSAARSTSSPWPTIPSPMRGRPIQRGRFG